MTPPSASLCSEVVPEQLRSTVYAFDRSFEGAVGATAAPLVGAPGLPFAPSCHLQLRLYVAASCPHASCLVGAA